MKLIPPVGPPSRTSASSPSGPIHRGLSPPPTSTSLPEAVPPQEDCPHLPAFRILACKGLSPASTHPAFARRLSKGTVPCLDADRTDLPTRRLSLSPGPPISRLQRTVPYSNRPRNSDDGLPKGLSLASTPFDFPPAKDCPLLQPMSRPRRTVPFCSPTKRLSFSPGPPISRLQRTVPYSNRPRNSDDGLPKGLSLASTPIGRTSLQNTVPFSRSSDVSPAKDCPFLQSLSADTFLQSAFSNRSDVSNAKGLAM